MSVCDVVQAFPKRFRRKTVPDQLKVVDSRRWRLLALNFCKKCFDNSFKTRA